MLPTVGLRWQPIVALVLRRVRSFPSFRSQAHDRSHISVRQYAGIVHRWIGNMGLDDRGFGTHSLPRTKAAQLYRKTGNLRAVQLLFGHAKIDNRPLPRRGNG
ncbi:MAG TPA: tyrosine-type recombinase/integrase [Devosia sp.]